MSDFQRKGEISSTNNIISDPADSNFGGWFIPNLVSKYAGDASVFYFQREKFRKYDLVLRDQYYHIKDQEDVFRMERLCNNHYDDQIRLSYRMELLTIPYSVLKSLGRRKSSIPDVPIVSVNNVESRVERQTTNSDCDVVSHVNHSEVVCSDTTNALTDIHCDVSCSEVQVYSKDSVYVEPTLIDLDVMPDVHTYEDVIEFASCDIEPAHVQPSLLDADVDMELELEKDLTSIWGSDIELVASSCVHNDVVSLESDYEFQHMQVGYNDISGITTCASVDTIVDRDHDLDVHETVPLECDMCASMSAMQVECMGGQATGVSASRVRSYGLCRERVPLAVSPLGAVHGSVLLAEDAPVRVVAVLGARRIFDPGGYSCTR